MRAYFFCAEPQWGVAGYQHQSVMLAEGFRELGIEVYSDRDYWEEEPGDYLFRHDPSVDWDDCEVVLMDSEWQVLGYGFPPDGCPMPCPGFFEAGNVTVWLDEMDVSTCWDEEYRQFDWVLKIHYNEHIEEVTRCQNVVPWVHGISNRHLRATAGARPFRERKRALWSRFRVAHPLRWHVEQYLYPLLESVLPLDYSTDKGYGGDNDCPEGAWDALMWEQCGGNHQPLYYNQLGGVQACAAFGGLLGDEESHEWQFVDQWDSNRPWEAFAAGCVVFHVDLERYGCRLPVMPENWVHYVGVDLQDLQGTVDRIAGADLEAIAERGREWALENYTPVPTAIRFVKMITGME